MNAHLVVGNNPAELFVCPDEDHCLDVALLIPLGAEVENSKLGGEMKWTSVIIGLITYRANLHT